MKKNLIILIIWGLLITPLFLSAQNKNKGNNETIKTIYGVRADGFSFYITGKIQNNGDDLKEFKELDSRDIEYTVSLDSIKVFFPIYNQAQLKTDYLIKPTLNWEDVKIVSDNTKFSINTKELLRISFKDYTENFSGFNSIFKDVIREKMSPFETKGDLKCYVYQYDNGKLFFIYNSKVPENLKDGFDVETKYETVKDIKKNDIAVFIPSEKLMYLKNGYKIYVTDDFAADFENQDNGRRIFIITRSDLRKKAEELYLKNVNTKYDRLFTAPAIFNTIGTKEYEEAERAKKQPPKINVNE